nr:hypothetical protein Iba_chr07fCG11750 [Ipomoea batatas]
MVPMRHINVPKTLAFPLLHFMFSFSCLNRSAIKNVSMGTTLTKPQANEVDVYLSPNRVRYIVIVPLKNPLKNRAQIVKVVNFL